MRQLCFSLTTVGPITRGEKHSPASVGCFLFPTRALLLLVSGMSDGFGSIITHHSPLITHTKHLSHGPAHRIPSELRSQPPLGAPSTGVGDHPGTTRADCRRIDGWTNDQPATKRTGLMCQRSRVRAVHGWMDQQPNQVPVAQRIRRETTNLKIAGSNPVGDTRFYGVIGYHFGL